MSGDATLSLEEAVERFLQERDGGSRESTANFAARFPHIEHELRDALDVLAVLDDASAVHARPADDVPERIANFRVLREVGRGGMGVVLEAVEEPLERRVALKVLPSELVASPSARARFKREAELAARLEHSGIATIYGAGVDADRPWIAMRFVEGRTLASLVTEARAAGGSCVVFPGSDAGPTNAVIALARCFTAVARALQFAHERGVVHRDVKPSNIVVANDGTPTLLDFGLAIQDETSGQSLTRTGETAGTPAYFAPEVVNGEVPRHDAQSDVYALGVSLYECLTTKRPFDAPTPLALYRAIGSGIATDPRSLNPRISRDLAVVVATAMERERGRRYASAARLADDLEAVVAGRPIAARPVPLTGRIARWARREPRQALLVGLLAVAALSVAALGGNWWVSRRTVLAAEKVARETQREEALASAFVALQGTDHDRTLREFERVLAIDPECQEAQVGLAIESVSRKRNAEALRLLESLPHARGVDALRAYCRHETITQDRGSVSDATTTADDFFLLGSTLLLRKLSSPASAAKSLGTRALAMLDEAVIRTRSPRLFHHIMRSYAARAAGDAGAARSSAGALLSLFPQNFHAVTEAGVALSALDPEAAIPVLERAATLNERSAAVFQNLAMTYQGAGRLEDAERAAWRACALGDEAECTNTLGMLLMMRECYDEGGVAFERAFAADPDHYFATRNLAHFLLQVGAPDQAELLIERLVQRDPLDAECQAYLAGVLDQLNRPEEALDHFLASLALDSGSGEMWAAYFHRRRLQGDREGALQVLDAGLHFAPNHPALQRIQALVAGKR